MLQWLLFTLSVAIGGALVEGHREHKIHNIVLYPDKHSWCEKQEIKQVISFPGCKSIEIDNNVCVGACFSYSIPHTEPSDPGEVIVPYCDSCQPAANQISYYEVTLDCREGHQNDPEQAPKLVKRVQLIHNCSCSSCEKQFKQHGQNNEDDVSLIDSDMPDIFDSIHTQQNETYEHPDTHKVENKHRENLRSILNNTVMTLLENIQQSNSEKDKGQLKDLLKMVRDQYPDENYSDESIAEIVESFNADTISLDIPKLKEILFKFEIYKHNHHANIDTNEVHFKPHHDPKMQPHGAQQTKLDMNPNDFKPNHAGTMVSYDSHHPVSVVADSSNDSSNSKNNNGN